MTERITGTVFALWLKSKFLLVIDLLARRTSMKTTFTRFAPMGILAVVLIGAFAGVSRAQGPFVNRNGYLYAPNSTSFVNPNYRITPDLTLNQYAYNLRVLGRAYRQIPPYALGYNPYPPPIYIYPSVPSYTSPYSLYTPSIYGSIYTSPYYNGVYLS
jgi:hypothetical protein